LFFILNLIGLGLGPLCVGLLSDALASSQGVDSLRYAIAIVSFMGLLSAACFALAARHLPGDLAASKRLQDSEQDQEGGDTSLVTS